MNKINRSIFLGALTMGVLAGCLWFYVSSSFSQAVPTRVFVAEQPGSPLVILVTFIDSSNPLSPRYGYSITNSSEKLLSAYTVIDSVSLVPGSHSDGSTFTHFPALKLLVRPHESRQEEGGYGKTYRSAPVEIVLTVDFVEFADGTRWGNDSSKSGEMLDGKRAGGKAAIRRYREILASSGSKGLEEDLAKADIVQLDRNPKSAAWADGFRQGVSTTKYRLVAAGSKGGNDAVRRELEKAFDSTDGRREP